MRLVGSQEAFEGLNSLGRECSWDKAGSSKGLLPPTPSSQPNSQPGHLPIMESRERPHRLRKPSPAWGGTWNQKTGDPGNLCSWAAPPQSSPKCQTE